MHVERDFDQQQAPAPHEHALRQDLELDRLLEAMAGGDDFLRDVATTAVLSSLTDPEAIVYRQRILGDCLDRPAIAREIYDSAIEALQARRKVFFGFRGSPDSILYAAVQVLELLVDSLKRLRHIGREHSAGFHSEGFARFFAMLADELDDQYFAAIDDHLRRLRFKDGVLMSARLGEGNTASTTRFAVPALRNEAGRSGSR